jgi:hypothetical protein
MNGSNGETKFDRANRRARKLRLRLGSDPPDDEYPDKPPPDALGDVQSAHGQTVAARRARMNGLPSWHGPRARPHRVPAPSERFSSTPRTCWRFPYILTLR